MGLYICVVCSKEKEKISEFLQEMQELGIGDPAPFPLPTADRNEEKFDPIATEVGSDSQTGATSQDQVGDRLLGLSPLEKRLMSEWVPLGLNFGIPLFSQEANAAVCDKVCGVIYIVCTCMHYIYIEHVCSV